MEKKTVQLIKKQESFKLTVTKNLERKIRYLCDKLPDNEYSGTLFYKVNGSFENKNIEIIAVDFYLQDIGTSTYTEFNNDMSLANYMVENNLLKCYQGLMHSHNKMPAFFSGTDINTLKDEGLNSNHFVSLIVNNEGNYCASITRKITTTTKGKATLEYNTFNNEKVNLGDKDIECVKIFIEYFDLKIDIEHPKKSSLQERIEYLKNINSSYINSVKNNAINFKLDNNTNTEATISNRVYIPNKFTVINNESTKNNNENSNIDAFVSKHLANILTGNIYSTKIISSNFININYEKRFSDFEVFKKYAECISEFMRLEIIDEFSDSCIDEEDPIESVIETWSVKMINELKRYSNNKYINYFIKIIEF